ncbi:C4-dicarboxylate transporter, DctM subunit [Desulfonispora thiosulfatigenes DSM 11270]|uniref:C4-dicarboxylate transporter, DctM subunit n=1 Tax=Desulfonispora thiosulfatigenes DSM 11270 TaxID=656914 RepID=A0A1W1VGD7_DESTI|nr:TRAP transporter large permease subunit [Desulfonispora thiosulfatigenes]SMB92447.1 C4-dicarboxylate transporter, DctM subunit [Desulfonispora thiosulfatigenes DSM 11270]
MLTEQVVSNINKPSILKRIIRFLDEKFEEYAIVIGFVIFTLLINMQVLNRYVLSFVEIANITTWTEEVARYIFIFIAYFGAALAIKKNENIRVDALINKVPKPISRSLDLASVLLTYILFFILLKGGLENCMQQFVRGQVSPALGLPMYIPYFAVPLGILLMAIRTTQNVKVDLKVMNKKEIVIAFLMVAALGVPLLFLTQVKVAIVLFLYFALLIIMGMPIAFALGASTLATTIATNAIPLSYFSQSAFTGIDSFPIMAIPFFVAAGIIMGAGSLLKRLLDLANQLVGSLPGGLALVTIITCMFFAAISGSGPATVAAVGTMMIPAMVKQGYNPAFATGCVAAAGSIGVIIPPSNPFVIYGVVGEQSVGKLFMAGIVPGVLIGLTLCAVAFVISKKNGWSGDRDKIEIKGILKATWDAKLALMIPIIILGGIYGGYMTPTEAAAVSVAYGLIIGLWVYRDIKFKDVYTSLVSAGVTQSIIIILIAMATIFGRLITIERVADAVAVFVLSISSSKIIILLLINLFLLFVGTVIECLAAIVILTPILLPVMMKIGVDPIHFGVIMVVNLAIGFITPPVGVNLFVASGISKLRIEEVSVKILPLLISMIVLLGLITFIPEISTWLPSLM